MKRAKLYNTYFITPKGCNITPFARFGSSYMGSSYMDSSYMGSSYMGSSYIEKIDLITNFLVIPLFKSVFVRTTAKNGLNGLNGLNSSSGTYLYR